MSSIKLSTATGLSCRQCLDNYYILLCSTLMVVETKLHVMAHVQTLTFM